MAYNIESEAEARRAAAVPPTNPNAEPPELAEGKTHHIFISHSEEEEEWAAQLVQTLEQKHGLKCLWPRREFTPGHEIADLIHSGIARSMKVLFVMSPGSLESGWCKYERNWAFVLSVEERENRVIPLLLIPCEVPNIFKTINYIDVPKGEDHVDRILRSYDKENDLKDIVPNFEHFLKKQVNGLKTEMYGKKIRRFLCRGSAWSFQPPTEYERYQLRKLGSKTYKRARKRVVNFSLEQVTKTKVLVFLKKNTCTQPPILVMMYYDINPCINYIRDRMLRMPNFWDGDDLEAKKDHAHKIAEDAVMKLLRNRYDDLMTWNKLEISEVNRHATFANKKCICEILHMMYWAGEGNHV